MADIELVIKIYEDDYEKIKKTSFVENTEIMFNQSSEDRKNTMMLFRFIDAIQNGTPLTKRIEYGTDGNLYEMSITNGKEYEGVIKIQESYDKGYKQGYADRIEMEKALRVKDCISRNSVIRMFNTMDRYRADKLILQDTDKEFPHNEVFIVDDCYELLDNLPSVNPTRAKGKWIDNKARKDLCNCSVCDGLSKVYFNFCQKCGADMRGANGNTDIDKQ